MKQRKKLHQAKREPKNQHANKDMNNKKNLPRSPYKGGAKKLKDKKLTYIFHTTFYMGGI